MAEEKKVQGVDNEVSEAGCAACARRTKERDSKEVRDLVNRLSRIEGQVRGIKRMVENDAYCTDILIQSSAANAALNAFNRIVIENHIKTCVAQDIRDGKDETVDELIEILKKFMR